MMIIYGYKHQQCTQCVNKHNADAVMLNK